MKKLLLTAVLAIVLALTAACVNNAPSILEGVTPPPTEVPAKETTVPSEVPHTADKTPEPTQAPTQQPVDETDALGAFITGSEHFIRYITFTEVVVYEEEGDTFLDGIAVNSYPTTIACAVDAVYHDEFGREISRARLQTRDGSYLLMLAPGETAVFARLLTDTSLIGKDFTLVFDMETGVKPMQKK